MVIIRNDWRDVKTEEVNYHVIPSLVIDSDFCPEIKKRQRPRLAQKYKSALDKAKEYATSACWESEIEQEMQINIAITYIKEALPTWCTIIGQPMRRSNRITD
jgi:hypothetical protein